jgi:colanic acid/amylovoran biosynthesis glycosyltransferase
MEQTRQPTPPMSPRIKPTVLIYRDTLLPPSETFIPAQVGALDRFAAVYVGTRREPGLALAASTNCLGEGDRFSPLWKTLFKTTGQIPPGWLDRLRRHQPQLIHAHFGPDGTFALPLARALDIPLVVTFHGYDATLAAPSGTLSRSPLFLARQFIQQRGTFYREQYLRRRSQLFAEADCILAVSQFIADRLHQAGCPESKLRVHYIGIDRHQFAPRTLASPPGPPIILFVGRLVEKKGAADLIQAYAQLQTTTQLAEPPRLVIIGDGPLRSDLETQAQSLNLKAEFLGHQPPESVRQWLSQAQIFCVPSRTARSGDTEGLGMVFAEAQSMGIPIVSCRSGGVPEIVRDGKTGLLVPEANPTALAAALDRILSDRPLRNNLSTAGPPWIADRFDLQTNTAALEQIYDEVLANHSPQPRKP